MVSPWFSPCIPCDTPPDFPPETVQAGSGRPGPPPAWTPRSQRTGQGPPGRGAAPGLSGGTALAVAARSKGACLCFKTPKRTQRPGSCWRCDPRRRQRPGHRCRAAETRRPPSVSNLRKGRRGRGRPSLLSANPAKDGPIDGRQRADLDGGEKQDAGAILSVSRGH